MSKKKTALLVAVSAAIGAAAGISYYLRYKSFNDELDKDFHDYEDEDSSSDEEKASDAAAEETSERTYITLDPGKCKSGECEETAKQETQEEVLEEALKESEEEPAKEPQEEAPAPAVTVEEDTDGADA